MKPILKKKIDLIPTLITLIYLVILTLPLFINIPTIVMIPTVVVSIFIGYICYAIGHNHTHLPIFNHKNLNIILDAILTINCGVPVTTLYVAHNLIHHQHTGKKNDCFWVGNQGNGIVAFRPIVYSFKTFIRLKIDSFKHLQKLPKAIRKKDLILNLILITYSLIYLCLDYKKFFLFAFIPWMGASFIIIVNNLAQHHGIENLDKYNSSYHFSNKTENILFFNGGHHAAHHVYPNAHWTDLPQIHHERIAPFMESNQKKGSMFYFLIQSYLLPQTARSEHVKS